MKLRLLDFAGNEHFCEVPNNTEQVIIDIISGDMVIVDPIYFDTCKNRIFNYYDGTITLQKEKFHKLNEITNSYELYEI